MNTYDNKNHENKSYVNANGILKRAGKNGSDYQIDDNRPEVAAQRKLQQIAANSSLMKQLGFYQEIVDNSIHAENAAQLQANADNFTGLKENKEYIESRLSGTNDIQPKRSINNHVVQLYNDLDNLYHDKHFDDKDAWLLRFTRVQELLNDTNLVDQSLKALTDWMVVKHRKLPDALADFEEGAWSGEKLILTDFVPPPLFLNLLREGKLFEDLVGLAHGVQSHRIQWFIIQYALGREEALALFKEAGNIRWIVGGKSMWDQIVDVTGETIASDFTKPSSLESYINDKYRWLMKNRPKNRLNTELHEIHEAQPELKSKISQRYPSENEYSESLQEAKQAHLGLSQRQQLQNENNVALDKQKIAITEEIMNEKITNTTTIDGIQQTIEWTGWIAAASSQRPELATTYFIPTVGKIINQQAAEPNL
jgi:hypothetical protein